MKRIKLINIILIFGFFNCLTSTNSYAHLMVEQQGTINVIDSDAFVVISLPISAFTDIDTNKDGEFSMIEFNRNRNTVIQRIEQNVILIDEFKSSKLIDILLSPVQNHRSRTEDFSYLTLMGKFNLNDISNSFKLKVNIFGKTLKEQNLKITIIRSEDKFKKIVQLNPKSPSVELNLY